MKLPLFLLKFLVFQLVCLGACFAQTGVVLPDSSVFTSAYEKEVFEQWSRAEKVADIRFFLALDYKTSYADIEDRLQTDFEELKTLVAKQSKVNKKIQRIYTWVHKKYFSRYNEKAFFADIFNGGDYNCVTATALYALAFEACGLPYTIKATQNHVYLVADPGTTSFVIETTTPIQGVTAYDQDFKSRYVKHLRDSKLIGQEEFQQQSTDALFAKYYLTHTDIPLRELAGLHYYNQSVFAVQNEQLALALPSIEKAILLTQQPAVGFLQAAIILDLLGEEEQKKNYNGRLLARLMQLNLKNEEGFEMAINHFQAVSERLIIEKNDLPTYENYAKNVLDGLADSAQIENIRMHYYAYTGVHYAENQSYAEGLSRFQQALLRGPDNLRLRSNTTSVVQRHWLQLYPFTKRVDSIDVHLASLPHLVREPQVREMVLASYARVIVPPFEEGRPQEGMKYFKRLEVLLRKYPELGDNGDLIGGIYGQVSAHYVRAGQYGKAKETLNQGLALSPGAEELRNRLRTIREAGK